MGVKYRYYCSCNWKVGENVFECQKYYQTYDEFDLNSMNAMLYIERHFNVR